MPPELGYQSRPSYSYSIAGGMNGGLDTDNLRGMRIYQPYTMYTQIKAPAGKLVFVEDCDTRTTNIGCWEIDLTGPN